MARRTNYSFEKRQKEIKRAKKREQKLARKQAKKDGGESGPPIVNLEDGVPGAIETPEVDEADEATSDEMAPEADGPTDEVVGPA